MKKVKKQMAQVELPAFCRVSEVRIILQKMQTLDPKRQHKDACASTQNMKCKFIMHKYIYIYNFFTTNDEEYTYEKPAGICIQLQGSKSRCGSTNKWPEKALAKRPSTKRQEAQHLSALCVLTLSSPAKNPSLDLKL